MSFLWQQSFRCVFMSTINLEEDMNIQWSDKQQACIQAREPCRSYWQGTSNGSRSSATATKNRAWQMPHFGFFEHHYQAFVGGYTQYLDDVHLGHLPTREKSWWTMSQTTCCNDSPHLLKSVMKWHRVAGLAVDLRIHQRFSSYPCFASMMTLSFNLAS